MWQTAKSTYRFCSFSELASFLREPDAHEWSAKTLVTLQTQTDIQKREKLCVFVSESAAAAAAASAALAAEERQEMREREREKAFVIVRSPPPPSFSLCGILPSPPRF